MWGMFRTFETLQDGKLGDRLESDDPVYRNRRLGQYPDGMPIERLLSLPDNVPPRPTSKKPGYPLYIPGKVRQKSPIPPWPHTDKLMPEHFDYRPQPTDLERNAFNNNPVPGELFTRRPFAIGQDKQWDGQPDDPDDLNPQNLHFERNGDRGVSRDVAVELLDIEYNGHGWHDPHGHLFYLVEEGHPAERSDPKEPLFFRALHGQILNLTLDNRLPEAIPGTPFDPPFPPCPKLPWEGECAMHVHMVKFDPICADGASVGWNYLSGPRFGKKMVYRWWLDQEFGTIFFHDHLFANYRQKHGLFGALIVEPIGAKFFHPYANQEIISGLQARIQLPATVETNTSPSEGSPDMPWFREFCIGIGDFIPMFDRAGNPLNPPAHPGGHGDQGVMALNYRNDPIRERLRNSNNRRESVDPAFWFSSYSPYNRDPFTTLFATFQNDPIWIRLVQGSHEEQHSFQIHGMRWRRFRADLDSSLRNQQTIGIAEAFTLINQETYKPGDYLYKLSGADDLWLGCWGIIRAFSSEDCPWEYGGLLPLAAPEEEKNLGSKCLVTKDKSQVACDNLTLAPETHLPKDAKFRHFHVVAEPRRLVYREPDLVDPYGLIYRLILIKDQDGKEYPIHSSNQKDREGKAPVHSSNQPEPLILRCREGEWVKVTLENCLPKHLEPEPFAPEVPVEEQNPFSFRPERPVSSQVSMHADLLRYEVRYDDGANVGKNMRQTIKPGEFRTYTWQASRPADFNAGEPLGPVLLQDMADFRNHRHHGLIGALIVESEDATPLWVQEGETTAHKDAKEAWCGSRVTVVQKLQKSSLEELHPEEQPLWDETQEERFEEIVLLLQDGIRLFIGGNPLLPVPDAPPGNGEDDLDQEDQGQKAFNYRTEPVGPRVDPAFDPNGSDPPTDWLANPNPATPTWLVPEGRKVRFHLVGACDKPRNHSFTIHGVTWPEWRFLSRNKQHRVASESAISSGTVRTFEFTPEHCGDHAYRSGVLKWAVSQGLWGILRVLST
jgi:FtsP/CotA-like multicopper oxidase with cupredoxin domain